MIVIALSGDVLLMYFTVSIYWSQLREQWQDKTRVQQDQIKNKVNVDIVSCVGYICYYNTFDDSIDVVYLTLRLHAVSEQTIHQDE